MIPPVLLALGLLLLIIGAEGLVRGASRLASAVGIPPLIIGLTVVAFGTSAPEMVVSVMSALSGQAEIALGNVVGSNIFNILFILGISALLAPLIVSRQLLRLDIPVMIAVSILALIMALDGAIGRLDGLVLVAGLVAYTGLLVREGRRDAPGTEPLAAASEQTRTGLDWVRDGAYIVAGLALLVLGARWFVSGAVSIAQQLGVDELVIGLTVIAAGTSLPEVATSIVASLRGERDIAVGNVIGSNIFNVLAVLGLTSVIAPGGLPVSIAALSFDLPIMIAVSVACLPLLFTGNLISRGEGGVFLAFYFVYLTYLVLAASNHSALAEFRTAMVWFVLPLAAATLIVVAVRELRAR